jgi:hypothetical protein
MAVMTTATRAASGGLRVFTPCVHFMGSLHAFTPGTNTQPPRKSARTCGSAGGRERRLYGHSHSIQSIALGVRRAGAARAAHAQARAAGSARAATAQVCVAAFTRAAHDVSLVAGVARAALTHTTEEVSCR